MSYADPEAPGSPNWEPQVAEPAQKKRSVKEFLKQYRALGLPGAKKFRRRTRLEEAARKHAVDQGVIKQLIRQLSLYMQAFDQLKKEENWTVRHVEQPNYQADEVLWVGESDPLEIIRKLEKAI